MKHTLLIAALLANLLCRAQPFNADTISVNNISARFLSNGMVSFNGVHPSLTAPSDAHFSVPKDSGTQALFAGSLWMGGFDSSFGVLHMSSIRYDDSLTNLRPGPIATAYNAFYNQRYDKVWKVSLQQISYHQQHFNDAGYTAPDGIVDWPGNGSPGNGEPWILAPFADLNGNTFYEPQLGEFPLIRGDEALYIIYSDRANINSASYGNPLLVDVHLMIYGYAGANSPALNNTLYVHYKIVNRSNEGYHDVLLGSWNDFDLGNFSNDRVGCDTVLNAFFVYNGNTPDPDGQGVKGYGNTRPAFGVKFLNEELYSFTYFTNSSPYSQTDPNTPHQYYNYMNGLWNDGTPFTTGISGYGGVTPTMFCFPSSPCYTSGWSENNSLLPTGDRRALGSTGKFNLPVGGSLCLDMAYVFAAGNTQAICIADGVDSLTARMQQVQAFYDNATIQCSDFATGINDIFDEQVVIYPNPATDMVTVELPATGTYTIRLVDVNGKEVLRSITALSKHTLSTSHLAAGVYFLTVENGTARLKTKLVIEK